MEMKGLMERYRKHDDTTRPVNATRRLPGILDNPVVRQQLLGLPDLEDRPIGAIARLARHCCLFRLISPSHG
jgi:hypothetical protein